jgi:hypothetical protein
MEISGLRRRAENTTEVYRGGLIWLTAPCLRSRIYTKELFLAMWSQHPSRVMWLTLKNPSEVMNEMDMQDPATIR